MLIRYPGSKAKIASLIIESFPPEMRLPLWTGKAGYCEPFFGAGAVGWEVVLGLRESKARLESLWINDIDTALANMWISVRDYPEELTRLIVNFKPSVAKYEEFKRDPPPRTDIIESGFAKLVLHQTSFSGLGAMSGGPIGGRNQKGARYTVDCRWNRTKLSEYVDVLSRCMRSIPHVRITDWDFEKVLDASRDHFTYCDPPYYTRGPELYLHCMTDADHARLARILKARDLWVLSYDDHPRIRKLYAGCEIANISMSYSIKGHRKNNEIVIEPR